MCVCIYNLYNKWQIFCSNRCRKFVVLSEYVCCILYANEINMKTHGIKVEKMQKFTIFDLIHAEKLNSCAQLGQVGKIKHFPCISIACKRKFLNCVS